MVSALTVPAVASVDATIPSAVTAPARVAPSFALTVRPLPVASTVVAVTEPPAFTSVAFLNFAVASADTEPFTEIVLSVPAISVTLPVPSAPFVAFTSPATVNAPPAVTPTPPAVAVTFPSAIPFASFSVTLFAVPCTVPKSLAALLSVTSAVLLSSTSVVALMDSDPVPFCSTPPFNVKTLAFSSLLPLWIKALSNVTASVVAAVVPPDRLALPFTTSVPSFALSVPPDCVRVPLIVP